MKNSEIKALSNADLLDRLKVEQESLQRLKFGHAISPIENPSQIGKARKLVARLKTELRSKEISK
ncbi:MAG TPA: 50S ribosomal protein L29 [Cytophagaceae bacterium]|jgi:large subunit ribosomal protein L29